MTSEALPIAAALLAGGESRRMGSCKATLVLGGVPLWRRQVATLRELQPGKLVVSGNTRWPGVHTLADRRPGNGPLGGVATVLAGLSARFVVVLAVDLPLVTSGFLMRMVGAARLANKAVIPWEGRRWHPLAAVYTLACLPVVETLLERGELRMQELADALMTDCLAVPWEASVEEAGMLRNVNTPEDFQEVEHLLKGDR